MELLAILTIICFVPGVVWIIMFFKGFSEVRKAESIVDKEFSQLLMLSIQQAEPLALDVVQRRAQVYPWREDIIVNIEKELAKVHPALANLMRSQQRIKFRETGTILDAEFLLRISNKAIKYIGENKEDGYTLAIQDDSPIVYELSNGIIKDEYPSIFHYILIVEDHV